MDAKLLYQKHMGFNPRSGKNEPNRLYLADLEVTAKDVYIKREPLKSPEPLGTSGLLKKRQDLDYTNNLDTNRYNIDTQKLDFSTANFSPAEIQKQNQDLVNHANDFLTDEDSGLPVFLETV